VELLSDDKGKPVEKPGRKTKGPVKWQPVTEGEVFCSQKLFK
jgi:hypothetical protein